MCRFTRELLFMHCISLSLALRLAFTLLSRQRLYPRATNLTFSLIVHVLVLGSRASHCGVMLKGFFPAARQRRQDHNPFCLVCSCCLLLVISSHNSGIGFWGVVYNNKPVALFLLCVCSPPPLYLDRLLQLHQNSPAPEQHSPLRVRHLRLQSCLCLHSKWWPLNLL